MSIKEINSLIIENKHEDAYKALLGIKPSFQVLITESAGESSDSSPAVKQLTEEMKKQGIEGLAVVIYDGSSHPTEEEPFSYPNAVETQLEARIVLIIADIHSFKTDDLLSSYYETVRDLGSNNLVFEFPDEVKGLVTDFILQNTEYDLENCILVLRSGAMEFHLRNDKTDFKACHKQTQNTIYVDRDSYEDGKQVVHGKSLLDIFTDLNNLPSEKYKHILKIHDYESNQDPVYYSDTWMGIANEVDKIHGSLYQIDNLVRPLKQKEPYRYFSDASVMKKRFFAEAVYRNMVFIHVDYLPNVNKPTNSKQQAFYDVCKLVYSTTCGFIANSINPLDIVKVAEMKHEHEENLKKVDILSIPPDAGMEFLPA